MQRKQNKPPIAHYSVQKNRKFFVVENYAGGFWKLLSPGFATRQDAESKASSMNERLHKAVASRFHSGTVR